MRTFHLLFATIFSASIFLCNLQTSADEASAGYDAAHDLLNACLNSQQAADWIEFDGTRQSQQVYGPKMQPKGSVGQVHYQRKYKQLAIDQESETVGNGSSRNPGPIPMRYIIGDYYIAYRQDKAKVTKTALVSLKQATEKRNQFLNEPSFFGPLDGYILCVNDKRAAELLLEAKDLHLVGDESVGGNLCRVVEGTTKCGVYRMWLDPACGTLPRKVTLRKGADDLMPGGVKVRDWEVIPTYRPQTVTSFSAELTDVELVEIGNGWATKEGKYSTLERLSDGVELKDEHNLQRRELTLKPDFNASDPFVPGVRDGTPVTNLDEPDGKQQYEWRDKSMRQVDSKK